jgi:hypothetical protein
MQWHQPRASAPASSLQPARKSRAPHRRSSCDTAPPRPPARRIGSIQRHRRRYFCATGAFTGCRYGDTRPRQQNNSEETIPSSSTSRAGEFSRTSSDQGGSVLI